MFCSKCGSPNADGAAFCAKCGNALGAAATSAAASSGPAASAASAPAPQTATMRTTAAASPSRIVVGKNPTIALVLSIFLGALGGGQFYNGDWKKGLAMLALTLVLGLATGGLVSIAVWIWSMVDAYQVASGKWSTW
jgi:TM2 domain-containing membrane protein YozV